MRRKFINTAPFTRALVERSQWVLQYAGGAEGPGTVDTETGANEIPTVQSIQFTKVDRPEFKLQLALRRVECEN